MTFSLEFLLASPVICDELRKAWQDSRPGATGGHEEGGFILRDAEDDLTLVRWPQGSQFTILVPSHDGCRIDGMDIVASFHTHPNTSADAMQEPGETDRRAVRDDPDLKGPEYIGEFVLSQETIYLITPGGQVRGIGDRIAVLGR